MNHLEDAQSLKLFVAELADAARRETLARWSSAGAAEDKSGGGAFDPVTEADREAERVMRVMIEGRFPEHGIAGEEFAERPSNGRYVWSLDPIDGTRAFICGMPTWVTLIALLEDRAPKLGLIDAPRLDERYIGDRSTSLLIGADGETPIRTSGCRSLSEARLSTTDPYLFRGKEAEAFEAVRSRVRTTRYGHDGYAYARLAAGTIDLAVESGLNSYDYNALVPVVLGAGGAIGNWNGGSDLSAGQVVAAASAQLFEQAVELLNPAGAAPAI